MTPRIYSNTAVQTSLVSGLAAADLSLTVADATGYPAAPFAILVDVGSSTYEEVMLVTAKAGAVFTVTRAYDGTTAKIHAAGALVIHAAIADDLRGMQLGAREVSSVAPSDGDVITWDAANSAWEPGAGGAGAAPASATYVTLTANAALTAEAVLGSAVIMAGLAAARPAAATAGRLYYATDTDTLSRDNGSGWDDLVLAESQITGLTAVLAAKQPLDADLTAIAALATAAYGRSLLEAANAAAARATLGVVGPAVNEYIASDSYTIPTGATFLRIVAVGGGAGGGSGRRGAAGTARWGGGGGGSAPVNEFFFPVADLGGVGAVLTITIGTGGAGGAARTADDTDGATGGNGATTSIVTGGNTILQCGAGLGGAGGSATAGAGGGTFGGTSVQWAGATGGASAVVASGANGQGAPLGAGSGAGGGGVGSTNVHQAGGTGGPGARSMHGGATPVSGSGGGAAGGTGGSAGLVYVGAHVGNGGGGGGGNSAGAAGGGGDGIRGGGGGGGGGSVNGSNSGAGGNGGAGYCRIYAW